MLGVAGDGDVPGHSVSSRILAAVSPSPALPTGLAPGRQGEGDRLTSKHNMFHKRVC